MYPSLPKIIRLHRKNLVAKTVDQSNVPSCQVIFSDQKHIRTSRGGGGGGGAEGWVGWLFWLKDPSRRRFRPIGPSPREGERKKKKYERKCPNTPPAPTASTFKMQLN